ncbi:hypothetical protein KM043_007629 [Ampulex compressa]|nr:hypothetical protein KM043_007629 [Ampulex compressa]
MLAYLPQVWTRATRHGRCVDVGISHVCFLLNLLAAYWNEYTALQEALAVRRSTVWKRTSAEQQQQQQQQQQQRQPRPQQQQQAQQGAQQLSQQGHVCENCGKSYKQRNALWRHFKYECGKSPRFQCPYCRYRTKQRSNMYSHIKHRHVGLKIYVIDLEADN